jgi:hypothetical protein
MHIHFIQHIPFENPGSIAIEQQKKIIHHLIQNF